MNNADTELIFEAYMSQIVGNFQITEEEAAQVLEKTIKILFEHHNLLIQEGFIDIGKKFAINQLEKSFPVASIAAEKAFNMILNSLSGVKDHREVISAIIQFLKAAIKNDPTKNDKLLTTVVAALKNMPEDKVKAILSKFIPAAKTSDSPAAPPPLSTESFNYKSCIVESVEKSILNGIFCINLEEKNIAVFNTILDIIEEAADAGLSSSAPQGKLSSILDVIQTGLDIVGVEPTVGTGADAANSIISLLRAAVAKEPDQGKKHLINAAISAVSMIPFADVAKILKARKFARPLAKGAIAAGRAVKSNKLTRATTAKLRLPSQILGAVSNSSQEQSPVSESFRDALRGGIMRLI